MEVVKAIVVALALPRRRPFRPGIK